MPAPAALENPLFSAKRQDPKAYRVPREALAAPKSLCGANDMVPVNDYFGTLGKPQAFVRQHQFAVGAIEEAALDSASKYCSGTLIGPDLFITASHCVDGATTTHSVAMSYEWQAGSRSTVLPQQHFRITEVVENGSSIDYAVLRLAGDPGTIFGWASLRTREVSIGEQVTVIQHPEGQPKQVEIGPVASFAGNYMEYSDLDTNPGSSGSGVLDASGALVGIHTNGGCFTGGGTNSGVRLNAARASSVLSSLANRTLPFSGADRVTLGRGRDVLALVSGQVKLARLGASSWTVEDLGDGAYGLTMTVGGRSYALAATASGVQAVDATRPAPASDFGRRWRAVIDMSGQVSFRTVGGGDAGRWLGTDAQGLAKLGARASAWTIQISG